MRIYEDLQTALHVAKRSANDGPRVAAVVKVAGSSRWATLDGYMDEDTEYFKQVFLVTPDGRIWEHRGDNTLSEKST